MAGYGRVLRNEFVHTNIRSGCLGWFAIGWFKRKDLSHAGTCHARQTCHSSLLPGASIIKKIVCFLLPETAPQIPTHRLVYSGSNSPNRLIARRATTFQWMFPKTVTKGDI